MSSFSLYNTHTKQKDLFIPQDENEVSFYSCGPTVYNRVHIGNLRAFLFADTLYRYLRFGKEYDVKWVMNITDVDDKTIRDSSQKFPEISPEKALKNFTEMYAQYFFEDLEKLNIKKENFYRNPKATDYILEMQKVVQKIVDNGYGYVSEGSVYFDVKKYSQSYKYGQLVNIDFDEMQSTSRVDNDEYEKSSASDFVLWKAKKEGEPSWEFVVNGTNCEGRPGWHLECTAMSNEELGIPFDIHSGGVDLCFPHHEDEIAQSVAAYEKEPAKYWAHNEHLMVEGKKMSKSLGNFYTLEDLEKKGFSPEIIRFFLVSNHYRTKVNLSDDSLLASAKMLKRMKNFLELGYGNISKESIQLFSQKFFAALDDDLNVSVAIAELFQFLKTASEKETSGLSSEINTLFISEITRVENIFGISLFSQEENIPENILALYKKRLQAREDKNWERSDVLRDEISALGYEVRDGKNACVKKMS